MSCAGSCRGTGDGKHPNSTGGMQGGLQWAQGCSKGLQQRADPPPPIAGRHCCSAQVSGGPAAQPQQLPTSTAGGEGVQRPNYTGKGDPAARPHVALCSVLCALCFVLCAVLTQRRSVQLLRVPMRSRRSAAMHSVCSSCVHFGPLLLPVGTAHGQGGWMGWDHTVPAAFSLFTFVCMSIMG